MPVVLPVWSGGACGSLRPFLDPCGQTVLITGLRCHLPVSLTLSQGPAEVCRGYVTCGMVSRLNAKILKIVKRCHSFHQVILIWKNRATFC